MNDHPQPHDDGLSPAARAALAALRAEDELAADVRDRMWSRLAAATAEDVLSDMSRGAAPTRRLGRGGVLVGLAIAAALTLALVGLQRGAQSVAVAPRAGAAAYGGPDAPERATRAASGGRARAASQGAADGSVPADSSIPADRQPVPADSSSPADREPVPEDSSIPAADEHVPEDSSIPADREPRPEPGARRKAVDRAPVPGDMPDVVDAPVMPGEHPRPDASASRLAAEAALLQGAQTALASGAPAAALLQLEQHAREFPAGVLAQEREALRVVALCAAGREREGRAEAATFLRAHAGSVLAERVRGACDGG
jgi:hypothetical protein